ncbi:hypothetical protein [Neobacillus drentensis]|uniref:hypothetical protein n=1 Tax=Neobacillus drentensis TaxID=220684 RepID=UPI002FFEB6C3
MINTKASLVERVYSHDNGCDFNILLERIITNKIEELVHNGTKVNTATSQFDKKGLGI